MLTVRLFGAIFIWAVLFAFPAFMQDRVQKYPDKRTDILGLFPTFVLWLARRVFFKHSDEDTIHDYIASALAQLMLVMGIGVNLIGEVIQDEFIASLGVEIIGAFVILRTIGLFAHFLPPTEFRLAALNSDVEKSASEIVQPDMNSDLSEMQDVSAQEEHEKLSLNEGN